MKLNYTEQNNEIISVFLPEKNDWFTIMWIGHWPDNNLKIDLIVFKLKWQFTKRRSAQIEGNNCGWLPWWHDQSSWTFCGFMCDLLGH